MAGKSRRPELNPIIGKPSEMPGFEPRWINVPDSLGAKKTFGVDRGRVLKADTSPDDIEETD